MSPACELVGLLHDVQSVPANCCLIGWYGG